jgi:hypothetical protein
MKIKHYLSLLFLARLFLVPLEKANAQVMFNMLPLGIQQNRQQQNPAAFGEKDHTWLQVQGVFYAQVPALQSLALDVKKRLDKIYLDQYLSVHGIRSFQDLQSYTNLGLELNSYLKVGIGLGFQTLFQPAFYGQTWGATARLGLQLKCSARDWFGYTFQIHSVPLKNTMNWAYHHQVSSGLEVFVNINWALYLPPTLQIGYIQQLENYRLCFFGAVQPQHFGFYIDKKQIKQLNWSLGFQWQAKIGASLLWSIQIKPK